MEDRNVVIGSEKLRAEIAPMGAEMQALLWRGKPLLWNGDPAYWTGRAPILFPIVGRAPGDRIAVRGREVPMRQHGFARRSAFRLQEQTPVSCLWELTPDAAIRAVWPFDFRLRLGYAISGSGLRVTATVLNRDTEAMPFGLGFHPAFLWPLPGAEGRPHRITLANGAEPALARVRDGLLGPERFPSPFRNGALLLDPAQFAADAMIFPEGAGEGLSYRAEGAPDLRFRFSNLPNLGIWQKPGAPFICIEPWHGMAARIGAGPEVSDRPFAMELPPGEEATFFWEMTVVPGAV